MKFLASKIVVILLLVTLTSGKTNSYDPKTIIPGELESGWYNATVIYSMHSVGYNEVTYSGQVEVDNDKVIDLQIGGVSIVHSGSNSIYSGGVLKIEKDFYKELKSATTVLCIKTPQGYAYYQISIE